jgi:hypothetical protein
MGNTPKVSVQYTFQDITTNKYQYKGSNKCISKECKKIFNQINKCNSNRMIAEKYVLANFMLDNNINSGNITCDTCKNNEFSILSFSEKYLTKIKIERTLNGIKIDHGEFYEF